MVLTAQQVRDLVVGMRSRGLDVGLRDVSFAVLASVYGDESLAFRAVFGDSPEIPVEEYLALQKVDEVRKAVLDEQPDGDASSGGSAISFDDLKEGLIDDMRALEKLRDAVDNEGHPTLEAKEMAQVVGRIADIRVKLTEKFNTTERVVEQRVVVEQKYDSICPGCGREISVPSGPQIKTPATLF